MTRHRAEVLAATLGAVLGFLGALGLGAYGLRRAKALGLICRYGP